jgi:chromosome segregation protein
MQFFKRLELHGFKSFANKTTIEFLPGVTVIAGPNGSGKSNIFDAIRWVLGEQSAKSLRGARMGDVIFNGSASLKATGMAKVDLVLDNSQRHLPIDFDEVSIARHLYRTGESEYLLNRTPCRLKDISTLLMDTGIGTDSYSVLEQGRVGAIINSRPLERRILFDEATGISKYKASKEEALAKLARTEESLLRLTDIIAEVRRQANSLKRQASKAERYKRLSAELHLLEKEQLVRHYRALMQERDQVEASYEELHAQVERLRGELDKLENEQEEIRRKSEQIQLTFEQTRAESFAVANELTQIQGQIELYEQKIATCDSRITALSAELAQIAERLAGLDKEIATVERDRDNQKLVFEELEAEYKARKQEYEALKSQCDAAGQEALELRKRLGELQIRKGALESQRQLAHAMEAKLKTELEKGEAEYLALQQQIEALAIEKDEYQSSKEEALQLLDALKADLAATQQQLRAKEQALQELRTDYEKIRREAQTCRSRHDALVELQENFEGYYGGVREVMLRAKAAELQGIIGAVSTLIEAADEHELAIEVALGGQAQDIIVETAEAAKAAIEWLKRSGKGRATFLPLDLIEARERPPQWEKMRTNPGVLGLASELVHYDKRVERAVSYLLGNVVVCRDLDTAVELKRQGFRARFVTLEGELVLPQGAMTGGSAKSQGLLHRTREIRKLNQDLQVLQNREAELASRAEAVTREISGLKELFEKLQISVNRQEIEAARTTKDLEIIEQKLAERTAAIRQMELRREEVSREIAKHHQVQEQALAEQQAISTELQGLETRLAEIDLQTTSHQQELAAHSQKLNDLVVRMSTAKERLNNFDDKLETLRKERHRLLDDELSRRNEIEELRATQQEAREKIERFRATICALEERQKELSERLTFETTEKETISLDLHKLGERGQELRRDYNEAQNAFYEVQLRKAQLEERQKNLEQQAQEKFHTTMDELVRDITQQWSHAREQISAPRIVDQDEENGGDGAVVEQLAVLEPPDSLEELTKRILALREKLDSLGVVHVGAIDEYTELMERYEFLTKEEQDLLTAKAQLTEAIRNIDEKTTEMFERAFEEIRTNFQEVFRQLFGGGRADLVLMDEGGILDAGVDIIAQPPGKKPTHISLLSGGEKALTAIALLFAIFKRKPSPVCILDEIEAPLDDKNVERFKELVQDFTSTTQFIIITHNKQMMALANTIYGVTMEEEGVSRVVSLRLDEYDEMEFAAEPALT